MPNSPNFNPDLEKALTVIQSAIHDDHKRSARVRLPTGHVVSMSVIRRRLGGISYWWGMSAPDGRTLLGGLDKGTCRTKATKILRDHRDNDMAQYVPVLQAQGNSLAESRRLAGMMYQSRLLHGGFQA